MKRDDRSPEGYRRSVKGAQKELLEAIRKVVLEAARGLEEGIRYGMLDYPGLANLAARKRYVSPYVMPAVLARRAKRFDGVDRGKSCLRFERLDQLDEGALRVLLEDVGAARSDTD